MITDVVGMLSIRRATLAIRLRRLRRPPPARAPCVPDDPHAAEGLAHPPRGADPHEAERRRDDPARYGGEQRHEDRQGRPGAQPISDPQERDVEIRYRVWNRRHREN